MSIGPRLELRQSQQLVMTPQLQQAIRLLQMSNLELGDFVDAEVERNPLLERGGEALDDAASAGPAPEAPNGNGARADDAYAAGAEGAADHRGLGALSAGLAGAWGPTGRANGFDRSDDHFENTLAGDDSLIDSLERQIAMARADPVTLLVARAIAADLDEGGYFRADAAETAERLGVSEAVVEQALAVVQSCEPTGIGARDVRECLALQLRERGRYGPAMRALVENIELVARADFARLRQACQVGAEELSAMIAEIKTLEPRPARAYSGGANVTIAPDVFVRRGNIGSWIVELNTATLPRVLVNNTYAAEISRTGDRAARIFISECQQNANWLVKSLAQRARTILKVADEIVRQQDGFFAEGVSALKPMTLRSVAEAISMHESTVSRVTSGKFLATDRGTFELKYFFTAAISASDGGDAHSAEAVRRRIAALIADESAARPLSDERIANLLEESGVDIARRTVAKYREAMNIPSSSQRKRLKAVSTGG